MKETLLPAPLVHEIADADPLCLFAPFAATPWSVLLESTRIMGHLGRYSFIGIDPYRTLSSKNGRIVIDQKVMHGDPFAVLEAELSRYPMQRMPDLPPFQGGAAGYLAYDLCHHLERLPSPEIDDLSFPDLALGFYDLVIGIDHQEQRAWIFSSGYPEQETSPRLRRARARCQWLLEQLERRSTSKPSGAPDATFDSLPPAAPSECRADQIIANFSRAGYERAVQRVIDYIYAGDIFEANLSQRFVCPLPEGLTFFQLYCRLRRLNPAPFAAFVNLGATALASASPERFLRLSGDQVETRPIKGTRPRGATPAEDEALAGALHRSEKDRAENVTIVDLMRNDLSRVCLEHTVQVPQLCALESYQTVHHLVSAVVGVLRPRLTAVDLLRATFPGGSITGAPKIRAMEIIAELEPTRRGPYCGSIGYFGFNGEMDTSITIRTYAMAQRTVTWQAGGAVVADSDPAAEYLETLDKARALHEALLVPWNRSAS